MHLRSLKFLAVFFFCFIELNAQIRIDASFSDKKITNDLEYFHDANAEESIISISTKDFLPFNKTFPALQKQVFWFKLTIDNSDISKQKLYFIVNSVSIENLEVYQKSKEGFLKIFQFYKNGEKELLIPFFLDRKENFYFKVKFTKSVYFPINVVNEKGKELYENKNLLSNSIYYTFSVLVLLINLFFYFQTREKFFLYYTLLASSIILILFELDGFLYVFFEGQKWILHIDVVLHSFLLISLMLFTNHALQLTRFATKFVLLSKWIVLLSVCCFVVYLFSNSILFYSIGEFFNAIGLFMFWFIGIWLFKRLVFARFICIGYSVIYISNILYVLPSEFGMIDFGFTPNYFKLGSGFEMIVFLYAISYRYKKEVEEKLDFKKKIAFQEQKFIEIVNSKNNKQKDFLKKYNFTNREKEIVLLLVKGVSNKEIAEKLFITESTVKFHIGNIFEKTEVKKRTELINIAR